MSDFSDADKSRLFETLDKIHGHMGKANEFMETTKTSLGAGSDRFEEHDKRMDGMVTWGKLSALWGFTVTIVGVVLTYIGMKK